MYLITYFCPTLVRYTAFLSCYYLSNKPFDPSVLDIRDWDVHVIKHFISILEGILFQLWLFRKFSSHPKLSATLMGAVEIRGHGVAVHSLEDSRGILSLYGKLQKIFLNNNRNILVIKFEKHNSKNRRRVGCPWKANISSRNWLALVQ